jgi:hypothetical protein
MYSKILVPTHGRSGIGRWVLGSVAEKVIQHARSRATDPRHLKHHHRIRYQSN